MGNRTSLAVEPVIMTKSFLEEKVIQNMIHLEDLDQAELQKLVNMDGLEYDIIESLDLQHQSLVNIDDVWRFKFLAKLDLPNNYLERIEGLESLIYLKSLDLSFNFIKSICNLDSLVNLNKLNLTSNEIVVLENMDNLKKLETFLIRRNKIKSFDNIYYLRQFTNLSCLAIDKNPLTKETDGNFHIIAVLPHLKYLNFDRVTSDHVKNAFQRFPFESKGIDTEVSKREAFQYHYTYSDKEAYVDALANGQGFQYFLQTDKNYQLLHSFPPASNISQEHRLKVTAIFDKWHETGHKYYEQMQHEKTELISMTEKAKEFSLEISQEEESKFIDFKENIPKELCIIYQTTGTDEEKDNKLDDLRKTCEFHLLSTFKDFINSNCLCVDLMTNLCQIYEKEVDLLNTNYINEVEEFRRNLMNVNLSYADKLRNFYLEIHQHRFNISEIIDIEEDYFTRNSALLQLIHNKELIKMTLELSIRMQSTILEERINNLKVALHNDLVETLKEVSGEAFNRQSEQTRNAVLFCNKQKHFIDKMFFKSNIFKHYLGYR